MQMPKPRFPSATAGLVKQMNELANNLDKVMNDPSKIIEWDTERDIECHMALINALAALQEQVEYLGMHMPKLPSCTFPGGYNALYLVGRDNSVLCGDCASEPDVMNPVHALTGHAEGPPIFCEHCSKEIEADYGNPWEECSRCDKQVGDDALVDGLCQNCRA